MDAESEEWILCLRWARFPQFAEVRVLRTITPMCYVVEITPERAAQLLAKGAEPSIASLARYQPYTLHGKEVLAHKLSPRMHANKMS